MTQISDFTHLHLHSTYSILDGENQLEALVSQVKELGMNQVALTDHGTMMGSLSFYKACKKQNIKPIIGMESYTTKDADGLLKEERKRDNHHLVLIAKNETGYKNLMELASRAQLQNFYMKPRVSKDNLKTNLSEGLIALTACLGSEINRMGEFDKETREYKNREKMEEVVAWYKDVFGSNYYLEIQDNDDALGQQSAYNQILIDIGKNQNIPIAITSDAHYTKLESSELHAMLMAMQLGKTYQEYTGSNEMKYGPWFYIRSPEEMLQAAIKHNCEEAFWNTCEIGNNCNLEIELGKYKMPVYSIESEPDYQEFLRSRHNEEES